MMFMFCQQQTIGTCQLLLVNSLETTLASIHKGDTGTVKTLGCEALYSDSWCLLQVWKATVNVQILAESYQGLGIQLGTQVAALPDTWHCRVSAGTGWPKVSTLSGIDSNFYVSVAACVS